MSKLNTIREAIDAIAAGKFVVVVDDEDRENEGDLIIAADSVTAEDMAFMVKYTSGVVCCAITNERAMLFTYHLWLQTIPKPWEQLSQFL
ncbi:MAG: hypothetical protein Ct9H90mP5_10740 [Acidimicrobiaceae bacterium]|nr:MAG: hypothetical protein Ct9H90mP5_10740 [Acidimicrobiaceae bacterium]